MKPYKKSVVASVLVMSTLMFVVITAPLQGQSSPPMTFRQADGFAVSPTLRELANLPPHPQYAFHEVNPIRMNPGQGKMGRVVDPVEQNFAGRSDAVIVPGLSVEGVNNLCGCYPPDTNFAIGDTQIVEWVNLDYAVYDKTGALLLGPLAGNLLFANLGGQCASQNAGDPIAQYDRSTHRWLLAQNLFSSPYGVCVAVSTSSDATGSYYLYHFSINGFPDYPKWGIWPTGYFQTQNTGGGTSNVCGYNSAKLLAGDSSAEQICYQLNPDRGLLPGDVDSPTPPPAGQDEFFIGSYNADASQNHLYLYSMHPVFSNPSQSTFTGGGLANPITVPMYNPICQFGQGLCVPQLGDPELLEGLGDRVMYRFAYWEDQPLISVKATPPKPLPSQHWFVNHISAGSSGQVGERWYEFTAPIKKVDITSVGLFQAGTFAPDANYRWMGSVTRDKVGNIALGYSISSATMYASIAVAGRAPTDPLGQLGGELILTNGSGAQQGTAGRWGDYSDMVTDPSNTCILWYATEYLTTTGHNPWQTRMNQIQFDTCH